MKLFIAIYCLMYSFNSLGMDEPPVEESPLQDPWSVILKLVSWQERQIIRQCCGALKFIVDKNYPALQIKHEKTIEILQGQSLQFFCSKIDFCIVIDESTLYMINSETGMQKSFLLPMRMRFSSFANHSTGVYFLQDERLKRLSDEGEVEDLIECADTSSVVRCICDNVIIMRSVKSLKLPIGLLNKEDLKNFNSNPSKFRIRDRRWMFCGRADIINSPLVKAEIMTSNQDMVIGAVGDNFNTMPLYNTYVAGKNYVGSEDFLMICHEDSDRHKLLFSLFICKEDKEFFDSRPEYTAVKLKRMKIALSVSCSMENTRLFLSGRMLIILANHENSKYSIMLHSLEDDIRFLEDDSIEGKEHSTEDNFKAQERHVNTRCQFFEGNFSDAELVGKNLFLIFKNDHEQGKNVKVISCDLSKYLSKDIRLN